jgi:hypothetical protein
MKRAVILYLAGYIYFEVTKGHKLMVAANVPSKLCTCAPAHDF